MSIRRVCFLKPGNTLTDKFKYSHSRAPIKPKQENKKCIFSCMSEKILFKHFVCLQINNTKLVNFQICLRERLRNWRSNRISQYRIYFHEKLYCSKFYLALFLMVLFFKMQTKLQITTHDNHSIWTKRKIKKAVRVADG